MQAKLKRDRYIAEHGEKPTVKRRAQTVEQHYDDCGEDTTVLALHTSRTALFSDEEDDEVPMPCLYFQSQLHHWFVETPFEIFFQQPMPEIHDMAFLCQDMPTAGSIDIVSLCGGLGRVAYLCVSRWNRKAGLNFDKLYGFDLLRPQDQRYYWTYLKAACPKITVMSTPCTGLMGWSGLNAIINPTTHEKSLAISVPLARLGGRTAMFQQSMHHGWFAENPLGSKHFEVEEWVAISWMPDTVRAVWDQCMTGLKFNSVAVKKPSEAWSNDH